MIKNKTKNKILCKENKVLTSIFSKALGLMFSNKISDKGLVFVFKMPIRVDLHMFFVFYPIDVLFLDESKRVIESKENFRPFTVYISKKKAKYVLELPQGSIGRTKTKIGDMVEF